MGKKSIKDWKNPQWRAGFEAKEMANWKRSGIVLKGERRIISIRSLTRKTAKAKSLAPIKKISLETDLFGEKYSEGQQGGRVKEKRSCGSRIFRGLASPNGISEVGRRKH